MHHAGSFSGAARCDILWSDAALRRISRGRLVHAKAAPLQALGTNKPCRCAKPSRTRGYSSELGGVRRKAEPTAIATKAMTLSILMRSALTRDEIFGWSKRWPITRPHGAIHRRTAVSQGN